MKLHHSFYSYKRWYSIAEYAVFFIVLWVLFAAIIPVFIRLWAYNRNTQRITDIKTIAQYAKTYQTKNGKYAVTLSELKAWWFTSIPKDPSWLVYCISMPWYTSWDYHYFWCEDCDAVWPQKTYRLKNIVQIWWLMERESRAWEKNSWNWRAPYKLWEWSNCAVNAVWWAGTLIEWVKWNWVWGTWTDITSIPTFADEKKYAPWYNIIVSMERN